MIFIPNEKDKFIKRFIEAWQNNNKDIHLMAEEVWILYNEQWSKGYRQGKDDPDFEKEE